MSSQGELDLGKGRAARDAGLKRVGERGRIWINDAMEKVVLKLPRGWRGQMEDLRVIIEDVIGKPHHHNIYGALTTRAIKGHVLHYTGETRQMKRKSSHARNTRLLERI